MEIEARRFETGIPGFLIQGVLGPLEFHRVDGHQTSHQRFWSLGLPNCIGFLIFTHLRPGPGTHFLKRWGLLISLRYSLDAYYESIICV